MRTILVAIALTLTANVVGAQRAELRGSKEKVSAAYNAAVTHDFTFLKNPDQVQRFVAAGLLTRLTGNANYELHAVSFPYVRPEVKLFVTRLASQFRPACGEKLVVTSATRPTSRQPSNASPRSVHPTGMAVDFRIPRSGGCQVWIERVLLQLRRSGVLLPTQERSPPHYHVVLYPRQYRDYVARITGAKK